MDITTIAIVVVITLVINAIISLVAKAIRRRREYVRALEAEVMRHRIAARRELSRALTRQE